MLKDQQRPTTTRLLCNTPTTKQRNNTGRVGVKIPIHPLNSTVHVLLSTPPKSPRPHQTITALPIRQTLTFPNLFFYTVLGLPPLFTLSCLTFAYFFLFKLYLSIYYLKSFTLIIKQCHLSRVSLWVEVLQVGWKVWRLIFRHIAPFTFTLCRAGWSLRIGSRFPSNREDNVLRDIKRRQVSKCGADYHLLSMQLKEL